MSPSSTPSVWRHAVIVALFLSACGDPITPTDLSAPQDAGNGIGAAVSPRGRVVTPDDELAALADRVPGFGGVYENESGVQVVFLKDLSRRGAAEPAVRNFLASREERADRFEYRQGEFTFRELKTWADKAIDIISYSGVVYSDIDETRNRIVVGIADDRSRGAIVQRFAALGIPARALEFDRAEPVVAATELNEHMNPMPGGVELIYVGNDGNPYGCTQFPSYWAAQGNLPVMVTASHCTRTQGGVEGTRFFGAIDGDWPDSVFIGAEVADPNYGSLSGCPLAFDCRYSDAALVEPDSTMSLSVGSIARPAGSANSYDLTINASTPSFPVDAEGTVPSGTLHKVGIGTGWTTGSRNLTCINMASPTSGLYFLCQYGMQSSSHVVADLGDSGSPVFFLKSSGFVKLVGIIWGRNGSGSQAYFSSFDLIEEEVGSLTPF